MPLISVVLDVLSRMFRLLHVFAVIATEMDQPVSDLSCDPAPHHPSPPTTHIHKDQSLLHLVNLEALVQKACMQFRELF